MSITDFNTLIRNVFVKKGRPRCRNPRKVPCSVLLADGSYTKWGRRSTASPLMFLVGSVNPIDGGEGWSPSHLFSCNIGLWQSL